MLIRSNFFGQDSIYLWKNSYIFKMIL